MSSGNASSGAIPTKQAQSSSTHAPPENVNIAAKVNRIAVSSTPAAADDDITPVAEIPVQESEIPIQENDIPSVHDGAADTAYDEGRVFSSLVGDVRDMQRLGIVQELKRRFDQHAVYGFVSLYMATWEYVLVSGRAGFLGGGFTGLFLASLATVLCYSTVVLSLAEMSSMAPTSSGMYYWTSQYGPAKYRKLLSYTSGWMSTLGWVTSVSCSAYIVAELAQAVQVIHRAKHVFGYYELTFAVLGSIIMCWLANIWVFKRLPTLQKFALWCHLPAAIVIMIAILLFRTGSLNTSREVFQHAATSSGWPVGIACLINQAGMVYCNMRSESVVHISEEVQNASRIVPRGIVLSYFGNVIVGSGILVVMLFSIGPLDELMIDLRSEPPYLILFKNLQERPLAITIISFLLVVVLISTINALTTASRQLWAFARDDGFPFSNWLKVVNEEKKLPVRAVSVTAALSCALGFINMGHTRAFETMVSLCVLCLMSAYMLSIGCILYHRLKDAELPLTKWKLGRFGVWINGFAFFYCALVIFFASFPQELPIRVDNAPWAFVVWFVTIMITIIMYMVHGKKHYKPPMHSVNGAQNDQRRVRFEEPAGQSEAQQNNPTPRRKAARRKRPNPLYTPAPKKTFKQKFEDIVTIKKWAFS